jgi:putative toxin-antitoxin system antitoxin component (TIGR02293 family)
MAAAELHEVVRLLGGKKALGAAPKTERDLIPLIREGYPVVVLSAVVKNMGGLDLVAEITRLNKRTLQRRLERGARKKLTADESERLTRLARVMAVAESVFGAEDKAKKWLGRDNRVLGQPPFSMLDTAVGTDLVMDELGRIAHGILG